MADPLTLVAHLTARPDRIEDAKAFLLAQIEPTRAEAGCIQYHLHQSNDDPAEFTFYETFADRAAWDLHMETPHLRKFAQVKNELFAKEPDIRLLTMLSAR